MRFVPVTYESPDEFAGCRWREGGEGVTVLGNEHGLDVGEDVLLEITVRDAGVQVVVRGSVVWKREREDLTHRLPMGAGIRFHDRDAAKVEALTARVNMARKP